LSHIAYLIPTLERVGGAERQLVQLAKGMARRKWRVTVIALSGKTSFATDELSADDVSFLSLEMRHGLADPRGWNRLRRWITLAQPDILHAHLPHASLMARCIRLIAPVRVVVDTIHSPAIGGIARRAGFRLTTRLTNLVTAVSSAAAEPWMAAGMARSSDLAILPNGIDTSYWRSDALLRSEATPQSSPKRPFHWLTVGRLEKVKDHETLLDAFAMLSSSCRLTIAGSGSLERRLRKIVSDLSIDDRVSFVGFQKDIRHWMNHADGFVLSSRWEGLPISLMEAAACELPAVFTGTEGARELLPLCDSPLISVGNPFGLARAMQKMMEHPASDRQRIGVAARQRMVELYDLNSILNRYNNLYHYLLAVNPQPLRYRHSCSLPASVYSSTRET